VEVEPGFSYYKTNLGKEKTRHNIVKKRMFPSQFRVRFSSSCFSIKYEEKKKAERGERERRGKR
jgi:hypothetical protein